MKIVQHTEAKNRRSKIYFREGGDFQIYKGIIWVIIEVDGVKIICLIINFVLRVVFSFVCLVCV